MSNHIKGCSCGSCRRGMHTKSGGFLVQKIIRKIRHAVKRSLRKGEEPPPCHSRGYTD